MHVCFLNMPIEYYSPTSGGAIATIIMQTARELLSRGHDVTILTPVNGDETYSVGQIIPLQAKSRHDLNLLQRRFAYYQGKIQRWDWPFYAYYKRSFERELATLKSPPDAVVLFNDLVSSPYVKKVVPKAKVIVWLQNEQRTNQQDLSATLNTTDRFLTCSQYIKDWTCREHGIPERQVVVALSGVDLEVFKPRADYSERKAPLRVLFIGRIDPNKGPDIAAAAVAVLQKEGLSLSYTVAGGLWFYKQQDEMKDPFFLLLQSKMETVGANYLGHVVRSEVPALVRNHDVACVLSRSNEPFGLVALEAMASGCAVIASNRGGLPEACGEAAFLVDPDDFTSVVNTMRLLTISDEALRIRKHMSLDRASHAPWARTVDVVEEVLTSKL